MKPTENKGNRRVKSPSETAEGSRRASSANGGNGNGVKKVASLKNAVENGRYRVESAKVADKMVRDAVREIRSRLR